MPHSKCPVCGQHFDLYVSKEKKEAWYAEYAPAKKVGDDVSLLCFKCWKKNQPNQPPEPTPGTVTPRASARVAPVPGAAHL